MSEEKTEQPTDHKLTSARQKGQVHQSQDLNAAANLLALGLCLAMACALAVDHLQALLTLVLETDQGAPHGRDLASLSLEIARRGLCITIPFILVAVCVASLASASQVGLTLSMDPLALNFDKLNPVSGLKRLFSLRSILDLAKMILKAAILGSILAAMIYSLMPLLMWSTQQSSVGLASLAWVALLKLVTASALVFVVMGPLDKALQRWLFLREQRMTKDEVKREHKDMEGNPQIKGARRELAHELANADPKPRVPRATVVVTNPTHYAVALRYEPGVTPVPVVLAKGVDAEAMRIRQIAQAHKIPIIGNPPLARSLYRVPLDANIPEPLFEAVAVVLRWVRTVDRLGQTVTRRLDGADTPTAQP